MGANYYSPMTDEPFITEADIERLKARDDRWRRVDLAMKVDVELRESIVINAFLEAAARNLEQAQNALTEVNPTDTKTIYDLQVKAGSAKLVSQVLNSIRQKGLQAYASIEEDKFVELDRKEEVNG